MHIQTVSTSAETERFDPCCVEIGRGRFDGHHIGGGLVLCMRPDTCSALAAPATVEGQSAIVICDERNFGIVVLGVPHMCGRRSRGVIATSETELRRFLSCTAAARRAREILDTLRPAWSDVWA